MKNLRTSPVPQPVSGFWARIGEEALYRELDYAAARLCRRDYAGSIIVVALHDGTVHVTNPREWSRIPVGVAVSFNI